MTGPTADGWRGQKALLITTYWTILSIMAEATTATGSAPRTGGGVAGPPTSAGRAARAFAVALGLPLVATAALMIASPSTWFHGFPGVASSGPFNAHLSRDFGCALLIAGAGFLHAARRPEGARRLVFACAALLTLHALVHLAEASAMAHAGPELISELATVHGPAAIALLCAFTWPRGPGSTEGAWT